MFATRDQENLVHGHQQLAASKPLNQGTRGLQPKTPGTKYAKTPLRVPLNDENAIGGLGGKSAKGKGLENLATGGKKATFDKNAFVTPLGPKIRAPLGAKTTNAKAKGFPTPGGPTLGKNFDKTQLQASTRRPKKVTHPEAVKIEVHGDDSPLRAERDVEYAPPKAKDIPYESEDFPLNCINYEPLKKGNLTRGIHQTYHVQVGEDGASALDRRQEEDYRKSTDKADEAILKSLEEEWIVGDVPEAFACRQKKVARQVSEQTAPKIPMASIKAPATMASRKAVSALSSQSRPSATPLPAGKSVKPKISSYLSRPKSEKAVASEPSTMRHTAAVAASRSTIGYSKGRSTFGTVQTQKRHGGMTRSASNLSQASDVTITPARFAQQEDIESKKLPWLSAFEADDEDLEPALRGVAPECMRRFDEEEEEEFFMTLGS